MLINNLNLLIQAPPIPPPKRFNKSKDTSPEAPVSPAEAKKRKEEEDAAVAALNEAVEAAEASQNALDAALDKDLDYRDPIDLVEDEEEEEPYYDSVPLDGGMYYPTRVCSKLYVVFLSFSFLN